MLKGVNEERVPALHLGDQPGSRMRREIGAADACGQRRKDAWVAQSPICTAAQHKGLQNRDLSLQSVQSCNVWRRFRDWGRAPSGSAGLYCSRHSIGNEIDA